MCGQIHNEAKYSFRFDADVMEYYLRQLYGKKFDVEKEIEPRMWKEVLRIINEATVEGLSQSKATPTLEENFYTKLRQSNEVFAAFKVHSMGNVMAKMLVGDDGKLKPFRQWKDDVKGVSSHYSGRWLQTEYATAVARAHAAADWMEFEKNKDIFPNLRWMPTTSPNPEKTHEVFWKMKLTRPIGDKFWNEHMPGDHWNCKCSLEQTDDPATTLPTDEEMKRDEPQAGLKENPAKTGQLFDKSHPYFPKNCRECGFNKKKGTITSRLREWLQNAEKDCYRCKGLSTILPIFQRKAIAHLKQIKQQIEPYKGEQVEVKSSISGRITVLRRSLSDIYEHQREDATLMNWLSRFNFSELKNMKYEGWAENREYPKDHPLFDPNNPQKQKHSEAEYFTYYSLKIGMKKYWANVKMHKQYGEVIYTIEKNMPKDLTKGRPQK